MEFEEEDYLAHYGVQRRSDVILGDQVVTLILLHLKLDFDQVNI